MKDCAVVGVDDEEWGQIVRSSAAILGFVH